MNKLSLPAIALFTHLRDNGEPYPREQFLQEFPDAEYGAVIQELINEGIDPEPSTRYETPRGVLFQNRSSYRLRFD